MEMEAIIVGVNSSEYNETFQSTEMYGIYAQAFLIVLYSLTAALSFGSNVLVILVLITGHRSPRSLKLFLINLSLSDITMAMFSIPFTYTAMMLRRWIFDPLFCPVVHFMQHCSVIVSVYTLTAVGIDRYYAIMYPLSSRWTKSRGPCIIVIIWVVAIGISSVQLFHGKATAFDWNGEIYYECSEVWTDTEGKIYTIIIFGITFALPMLALTFTYVSIGWKMWRRTSPGNADATRDHNQLLAKIKVVKMLATVVLLFAFCWLPIHVFNLFLYFNQELIAADTEEGFYIYVGTFFVCHWLSMANSFVNPIIYCFMSDNFRTDLKQLVSSCCPSLSRPRPRAMTPLPGYSNGSSVRSTILVLQSSSHAKSNGCSSSSHLPLKSLQSYCSNKASLSIDESQCD